jgi:hypothetical protein
VRQFGRTTQQWRWIESAFESAPIGYRIRYLHPKKDWEMVKVGIDRISFATVLPETEALSMEFDELVTEQVMTIAEFMRRYPK